MACPFLRCPLFAISLETYVLILSEVIFYEVSRCVVPYLTKKMFRFFSFILISKTMLQNVGFCLARKKNWAKELKRQPALLNRPAADD